MNSNYHHFIKNILVFLDTRENDSTIIQNIQNSNHLEFEGVKEKF